jgi:hypothetical protein
MTDSPTLAAIRKCWQGRDPRFQIRVANIVKLKTQGIPCCFIANAANEWYAPAYINLVSANDPHSKGLEAYPSTGSRRKEAASTWRSTRPPAPRLTRRPERAIKVRIQPLTRGISGPLTPRCDFDLCFGWHRLPFSGGARAGGVYPVPLPATSPLRSTQDVHYVRVSRWLWSCVCVRSRLSASSCR